MIVVLLEMLSGACLLVLPLFFLSAHTTSTLALSVYDNDVFDKDYPERVSWGKKKKHKGVLFAFFFFPEVLTSFYKCQDKGGIFLF